jgi:hypothetical protein
MSDFKNKRDPLGTKEIQIDVESDRQKGLKNRMLI